MNRKDPQWIQDVQEWRVARWTCACKKSLRAEEGLTPLRDERSEPISECVCPRCSKQYIVHWGMDEWETTVEVRNSAE